MALGTFARRLAKASAGDRPGRGRGIGSAAALARHRHQHRRAYSSSRAAGEDWSFVSGALGAFAGGMMSLSLFSVKALFEKDADVRREEATNAFLRSVLRKRNDEIERLEKAWEEELAVRQKKLEK